MTILQANGAFHLPVTMRDHGKRLDVFIAEYVSICSRNTAGRWIQGGCVRVDADLRKPGYRVKAGEKVCCCVPEAVVPENCSPENIPLDVIYEDSSLIVVNKPAGLVVHPAPGHPSGTLVNALMYHCPDIEGVGGELRPGIVHRLDKDTSGLIVAAKTQQAHEALAASFQNRQVQKIYRALVYGCLPKESGIITAPIIRHPVDRKRMYVPSAGGRYAETHWKVVWCSNGISCVDIDLKTGRTHQIRVHMEHIGHPLVGDPVYTRNVRGEARKIGQLASRLRTVNRQMLHAKLLSFVHPESKGLMTFRSNIPDDMNTILRLAAS